VPSFEQFFVIPIVEESGKPTFGEWIEFATSQDAACAGRRMAGDYQGLIVAGTAGVVEDEENVYQPIAVFGDVSDFLLGMLASF